MTVSDPPVVAVPRPQLPATAAPPLPKKRALSHRPAGYRTTFVATGMAVFTLATAVFFHNNFADQNQMIHFLKNIAIAGGLFQVAAFGAGSFSLDALRLKGQNRALSPA